MKINKCELEEYGEEKYSNLNIWQCPNIRSVVVLANHKQQTKNKQTKAAIFAEIKPEKVNENLEIVLFSQVPFLSFNCCVCTH